jgi:Trypsin-like peptidase domain
MTSEGDRKMEIAAPSVKSLFLATRANGNELSTATGFVATHHGNHYLVTNWHVVTGRRNDNATALSTTGTVPDELVVLHNVAGQLGHWQPRAVRLYGEDGSPLWLEHPVHGRRVDVVALPLTSTAGIELFTYDPVNPGPLIVFGPSDPVSIIGFPFGLTGGGAAGIWVQGTVATEPAIDFGDLPCFLVDSRTRPGQSGSPAILYRTGGYSDEDGNVIVQPGSVERFVGIYSGRINEQSDLGFVWKAVVLAEIFEGQQGAAGLGRSQRPTVD